MKGIIVNNRVSQAARSSGFELITRFFLLPLRSGLYGFAAFFTLLIAAKFFWYLIGHKDWFNVTTDDVSLSLLGFAIVFVVRFAQNFRTIRK
jgi:hypothetical protein